MNRFFIILTALTISNIGYFSSSPASADEPRFRLVSKASGKCIKLAAPDAPDGGGLTTGNCQTFPDFFVSGHAGSTQLMFELNSARFACIFATDTPSLDATPKAMTRNCAGVVGSLWNVRGEDSGGFRQVEKSDGTGVPTGFCMQENADTAQIELDICQGLPEQSWKLERVTVTIE